MTEPYRLPRQQKRFSKKPVKICGWHAWKSISQTSFTAEETCQRRSHATSGHISSCCPTKMQNPIWPQLIDLYRASVLLNQGQLSKTQRSASTALKFFLSYPLPEKAAICHLLLARADLQAGDFRGADRHCCQALEQLRTLDAPMLKYQAHVAVGQLHEYERNLEAARDSYRAARLDLE